MHFFKLYLKPEDMKYVVKIVVLRLFETSSAVAARDILVPRAG